MEKKRVAQRLARTPSRRQGAVKPDPDLARTEAVRRAIRYRAQFEPYEAAIGRLRSDFQELPDRGVLEKGGDATVEGGRCRFERVDGNLTVKAGAEVLIGEVGPNASLQIDGLVDILGVHRGYANGRGFVAMGTNVSFNNVATTLIGLNLGAVTSADSKIGTNAMAEEYIEQFGLNDQAPPQLRGCVEGGDTSIENNLAKVDTFNAFLDFNGGEVEAAYVATTTQNRNLIRADEADVAENAEGAVLLFDDPDAERGELRVDYQAGTLGTLGDFVVGYNAPTGKIWGNSTGVGGLNEGVVQMSDDTTLLLGENRKNAARLDDERDDSGRVLAGARSYVHVGLNTSPRTTPEPQAPVPGIPEWAQAAAKEELDRYPIHVGEESILRVDNLEDGQAKVGPLSRFETDHPERVVPAAGAEIHKMPAFGGLFVSSEARDGKVSPRELRSGTIVEGAVTPEIETTELKDGALRVQVALHPAEIPADDTSRLTLFAFGSAAMVPVQAPAELVEHVARLFNSEPNSPVRAFAEMSEETPGRAAVVLWTDTAKAPHAAYQRLQLAIRDVGGPDMFRVQGQLNRFTPSASEVSDLLGEGWSQERVRSALSQEDKDLVLRPEDLLVLSARELEEKASGALLAVYRHRETNQPVAYALCAYGRDVSGKVTAEVRCLMADPANPATSWGHQARIAAAIDKLHAKLGGD